MKVDLEDIVLLPGFPSYLDVDTVHLCRACGALTTVPTRHKEWHEKGDSR